LQALYPASRGDPVSKLCDEAKIRQSLNYQHRSAKLLQWYFLTPRRCHMWIVSFRCLPLLASIAQLVSAAAALPSWAQPLTNLQPTDGSLLGPYGARLVRVNDHQGPKIEQVRLENGALQLQLSEGSVRQPTLASFNLQNLSREEQPILRLKPVNREGRQFARQLILENGDEEPEEDEEPTWPQAGDQVRFSITAGAFGDSFENGSNAFVVEVEWPGGNGILSDAIPPRLEEICSQGEVLKLAFSEPVSAALAAAAFEIDGDSVIWQSENDGFVLRTMLPGGAHVLTASGSPLDLAGLGLAPASSRNFTIDDQARGIYEAPFSGEAAQSAVGNVFGFQGLPEDGETGLLYVRNRYYDPEMGRFITPDPLGYVDGPNVYQFAMNSPVNFSDPLGLSMQASDYGGVAWQGFLNTKDQIFALGDLGMGGLNSGLIEGRNAYSEAREADYGIGASFMYALGRAKRQATAVQTLGFSEAQDPVAHAKALGMGLFDSLTGRDQFIKGMEASEHGESWEAAGRYAAGIGAILSNVAPMMAGAKAAAAEAKVARAMRAGIVSADAARMEEVGGAAARLIRSKCRCFVAGTPVATAQGEKPIEAIEIGDEVWARNPETSELELARVAALYSRRAGEVLQIHLSDGSGADVLEVTPEHPIFVPLRGWVLASDLQVGDQLLGLEQETPVKVEQIVHRPGSVTVFNFAVEGVHNYFAGQVEVLVHNENCDLVPLGFKDAEEFRRYGSDLHQALVEAGHEGVMARIIGSSITGKNYRTGRPFHKGSDWDLGLASRKLLERARKLGIEMRDGGRRTAELHLWEIKELGLEQVARVLNGRYSHQTTFMIYDDIRTIRGRALSVPVLKR
jgi:RHS repeat-associated protein